MKNSDKSNKHFDAIVVLGGGNHPDGSLNVDSAARVKKAVELFNRGLAVRIIFSGAYAMMLDVPPEKTEAASMKELAIELGISKSSILVEEQSQDTSSNAYFVMINFLKPNNWKNILVVAAEFHALRAKYLFEFVLGPNYQVDLAISDSGLTGEDLKKKIERERRSLTVVKFLLGDTKPGDLVAIRRYIEIKHPSYALQPIYSKQQTSQMVAEAQPDQSPWPTEDIE